MLLETVLSGANMFFLRAALLTLFVAGPVAADETIRFDVGLRGLTAAQIALTGRQDGAAYAVSAQMASTGLVRVFNDFSFTAEARGRLRGSQPAPVEARLRDDMGRNRGSVVLRYPDGVPEVERVPERDLDPWDVDPADQVGRADPLSVVWAAFRTRPADEICNVTLRAFDGRRAGDLILGPRQAAEDGTMTCAGEWVRVAGYDPEDMAERTRFPFTLTWVPQGDAMRLIELRAASRYGDAVLRRQ